MKLRHTGAEIEAVRRKASEKERSKQDVARSAIADYVSDRPSRMRTATERVKTEDAELFDRLSR